MKQCVYCKRDNPENARYCENCGMPLDKNSKVVCDECGRMIRSDFRFCPHCGTTVTHTEHCSACNAILEMGDQFCKNCGQPAVAHAVNPPVKREDPAEVINQFADILLDTKTKAPDDIFDSANVDSFQQPTSAKEVTLEEAQNDPNLFIDYCLQEGLKCMAASDFREAVNHFNKGVGVLIKNGYDKKEDRRLIQYYINRGNSFKQMNDIERAQDNFRRALMYAQSIFAVNEVESIRHIMAES